MGLNRIVPTLAALLIVCVLASSAIASDPTYAQYAALADSAWHVHLPDEPHCNPAQLASLGYLGDICDDVVSDIALDSQGMIYIIGDTALPGSGGSETCSSTDVFVAKLDPTATEIVAVTSFGGNERDYGKSLAIDSAGDIYVGGYTLSTEDTFPVSVGPDLSSNGSWDGFVAKLNGESLELEYLGFIGGAGIDYVFAGAVDAQGAFFVVGMTDSTEETFPTAVGPDITYNGSVDGFVAKVAPDGSALEFAGYFGGATSDLISDIVLDSGWLYMTGETTSTEATFPVKRGPDLTHNGEKDAFVTRMQADATVIDYAGYIGGEFSDSGNAIAVDEQGNAFLAGFTMSNPDTFPIVNGPSLVPHSYGDAFVASVAADGSRLRYAGYLGGEQTEGVGDIAVDRYGHAIVIGLTASDEATFPLVGGPDLTHNGGTDAFIAKIKPDGRGLVFSGYIGGDANDIGNGLALDDLGNAYFCGHTKSGESTFPVSMGPDLTYNGWWDGFVGRLDSQEEWHFLPLIRQPTGWDHHPP